MVLDNEVIPEVMDILSAADFVDLQCALLYETIISLWAEMHNSGTVIGVLVVQGRLTDKGKWDDDLASFFIKIVSSLPTAVNAVYYAKRVKLKAQERKILSAIDTVSQEVRSVMLDVEEKRQVFESAAFQLALDDKPASLNHINEIVISTIGMLQDRKLGIQTGFSALDVKLRGLKGGQAIIIAARPSMGKSSFMLDLVLNIAGEGAGVAIYSLEMSPQSLVERIIASRSRVSLYRMGDGNLTKENWDAIFEVGNEIAKLHLWIDGSPMLTPNSLTAKITKLKYQHKVSCIFIDYLQLMFADHKDRNENRQQEITKIMATIKGLAKRLDMPIVVLCQLNRACEMRADHRPILSDLRESGSIEQDADVVMFLHRDDYYRRGNEDKDGEAVCIIAKNRQGATGDVPLVWLPEQFSFKAHPGASAIEQGEFANSGAMCPLNRNCNF